MIPDLASTSPPTQRDAKRYYTELEAEYLRRNLRKYVEQAWPIVEPKDFVPNWHIDAICEHLTWVALGEIRFLMINIPPRHTKSKLTSVLWPTWLWTFNPGLQILAASYVMDLSIRDSVEARHLIESGWYQDRYGHVFGLLPDENQKKKYKNTKGGYRISTATGARTTGEGGDLLLYDDPHNMKDVMSDVKRHGALSWHDNSFRSRANDPNNTKKVYIGQRSHDMDVFGHVLAQEDRRWVVLTLPMEFDPGHRCITYFNKGEEQDTERGPIWADPRKVKGELLNPQRFNEATLKAERRAMTAQAWASQYNQRPITEGGLILKSNWWRQWAWPDWHPEYGHTERELPEFFAVVQVYDTAFGEGEENDFSVRTTWGLFVAREMVQDPKTKQPKHGDERVSLMLLDRWKMQCGFPELRVEAVRAYKEYRPDLVLVEKKASGQSLIQELRRKRIPVKAVPVDRDKITRAHMAAPVLEQGCVYYVPRDWAFDVINECKKFPQVEHDDQVDTCTMAWQYARKYMGLEFEGDDDSDKDLKLFGTRSTRIYR